MRNSSPIHADGIKWLKLIRTSWKIGISGALAGFVGALAMHGFRFYWETRPGASPQSGIYGFDEEADLNSVDELWTALSLPPLSRKEALRMALFLHYAFGTLSGCGYALLQNSYPKANTGWGTFFGSLLWLFGDEIAITATGLSDPAKKTLSSHTSALLAHLLFGTVTELGRKTLLQAAS